MKIFVLGSVAQLTDRWHCDGGLVVIAEDLAHAKEVISDDENIRPTAEEWAAAEVLDIIGEVEPKYITFPDAGCC